MDIGFVAQLVRALPCHGRGREFESRRIRHASSEALKKQDIVLRIESRRIRHFCFTKTSKSETSF